MNKGAVVRLTIIALGLLCCAPLLAQEGTYFVAHEPVTLPVSTEPEYPVVVVAPVDFDFDGDLDFVLVGASPTLVPRVMGPIQAFRNDSGVLSDATGEVIEGSAEMNNAIIAFTADFTGDGLDDVFIGGHGPDVAPSDGEPDMLLVGTAEGRLNDESSSRLPASSDLCHHAAMGDINGDEDLDIFLCNTHGDNRTRILVNDGEGYFTPDISGLPPEWIVASPGYPLGAALLDVDCDGDLDLFAAGQNMFPYGERCPIMLNDGTGSFLDAAPMDSVPHWPPEMLVRVDPRAVDIDHDGDADVFSQLGNDILHNYQGELLINRSDSSFHEATSRLPRQTYRPPTSTGDVNRDGWTDLLFSSPGFGTRLFLNTGYGFFMDASSLLSLDTWGWEYKDIIGASLGDMDLDGDIDLALFTYGGEYMFIENVQDYQSLDPGHDADGDGLTDGQETIDLDPATPGVQNPFNPDEADSTGDDGSTEPDGVPDGQNDWDGDGMANGAEFEWGFDPLYAGSYGELPATRPAGRYVLCLLLTAALVVTLRRRHKTAK